MMGDIALVGAPVIGQLIAYRSGHSLNHKLAQKVLDKPGRWELTDSLADKGVLAPMPALLEKFAAV